MVSSFYKQMVEIYNSTYKELRIMPYDYQNGLSPEYLKVFRDAPEEFILKVNHIKVRLPIGSFLFLGKTLH